MNNSFQRLMAEAARSTRLGDLMHATSLIQQALRGEGGGSLARTDAPVAPGAPGAPGAPVARTDRRHPQVCEAVTLEAETRVIRTEPVDAEPLAPARTRAQVTDPSAASPGSATSAPSAPSASSAPSATPERWLSGHFTHGGRALAYKLYIPPALAAEVATPRPLVVMLHGCTQSAGDFAVGTQMNALARQRGVIVLYPEQAQRANAQRCWNWFKPQHQRRGQGEPAALEALVRHVMTEHAVDAGRVFVAGLSAGGAMADILGQCYPDTFAGVAVHSGLPAGAASDVAAALSVMKTGPRAVPPRGAAAAVPTIVFHGDADMTVHERNGRAVVEAAQASASRAGDPRIGSRVVKGRSAHGQAFTQTVYAHGQGHAQIEHWQLHGAGHAWSGGSPQGSYTHPSGVDASAEMLRFFLSLPPRPRPVGGTH